MHRLKKQIFVFSSVLLLALSCSSNKTIKTRLNNQYTGINIKSECNCYIDKEVEHKGRYKPSLNVLLDFEKFNDASNWSFENDYGSIYFINMYSGFSMSLISKKPIKVTHKNNALTLNLTPCDYKDEFYIISNVAFNMERQDRRDLNEDFDYTAFAYFDYLTSGTNMREGIYPENVLKEILEERFFYSDDSDTSNEFKLFIREMNTKYETNIKEYEVLYSEDGVNEVDEFIVELNNAQINISDFIVNESHPSKINYSFKISL